MHLLSLSFCGPGVQYSLTGYSAKGHPTVIEVWVRLPSHLEAQMGKNLFPDSLRLLAELISLWILKEGYWRLPSALKGYSKPCASQHDHLTSSNPAKERESPE